MDRDSEQVKGWRAFRFGYGKQESEVETIPDPRNDKDHCCHKEPCGCGCYVAQVDVDELDQQ